MEIVVLGAGALGAYFGGRWQEAGQKVTYLVREKRAAQLREKGLAIHSVKGDYTVDPLTLATNPEEIDTVDLVLLSVKGYHLEGTLPTLRTLVKKGAKILPVLNGIEHIDILQKELGEEHVMGGLSFIIATLNEDGHVVHTSDSHDIVFGPLHPSQHALCEELAEICEKANMSGKLSDSIMKSLWKKYIFITAFSGITTAGNFAIGTARKNEATMKTVRRILTEMRTLANAYHVDLTDKHVDIAFNQLNSFSDESTSSMHQDRRKGLTLEVDHLQGGALRLAEKAGLTLPVIETLYGLIKPYEHGSID